MDGVSVILSTYNGLSRGFLGQAIESVLSQNFLNFELIIVDDGSTDGTEVFCKNYLNQNIKYLKKINGGPSSARNLGIKESFYDHITFLDDDDYFKEDMILEMHKHIKETQAAMVYCRTEERDEISKKTRSSFLPYNGNLFEKLLYGNFITTSAVMIDKRRLLDVGLFDENLRYSEDYDLWLRIAENYEIYSLDKALVIRRIHPNRLSSHLEKMQESHFHVLKKNLKNIESSKKNEILKNFYLNHGSIYLGNEYYESYRRVYREAKKLGDLSFIWKIKFFLSFFPFLYKLVYCFYLNSLKKIKEEYR